MNLDKAIVYDAETYPNYTLLAFKRIGDKKLFLFEAIDGAFSEEDRNNIERIFKNEITISFNGINFDLPIVAGILAGRTTQEIVDIANGIIQDRIPRWKIYDEFDLKEAVYKKHIDIMEVAPGVKTSLKVYGSRMHMPKLQDLPIEPNSILTDAEIDGIRTYCVNDLDTTAELAKRIQANLELRVELSKKNSMNLMSKSDPQLAEALIKKELEDNGVTVSKVSVDSEKKYKYTAPKWIKFDSSVLEETRKFIISHRFSLDGKGSIALPKELSKTAIELNGAKYKFGIGGLHSQEKKQALIPKEDELLLDLDVASYYPAIIINNQYFPEHLTDKFIEIYEGFFKQRMRAKSMLKGNLDLDRRPHYELIVATNKLILNGSFGKFGSKYSFLYDPKLLLHTTITGQLGLLMLIEQMNQHGIAVKSANTDGIVVLLKKSQYQKLQEIWLDWELMTGFTLEQTDYSAVYSRDVNNYLAVKTDGSSKGKGVFAAPSLMKTPVSPVVYKAVAAHLTKGTPIRGFVCEHEDLRDFIIVRGVAGGGVWRGQFLGKVVRWIYGKDGDPIVYKTNGNKVATSDGAIPVMDLSDMPSRSEMNMDAYIKAAEKTLMLVGM